ncbi:MAG TPA: energy transducer TonB [Gemmatimonadales bacterium]|nr:energy transducer TonB [Gemmatimonadales bacterium]
MTGGRGALAGALALLAFGATGCGRRPASSAEPGDATQASAPADQEPPVALNGDAPIQYPPRLYDQKVEGDVVLRLFVDSTGRLAPESSKVAESSGYTALDSAALAGARQLRFSPARRHGLPIATTFVQPIEFRHPGASGAVTRGAPDSTSSPSPPSTPSRRARRAPEVAPGSAPALPAPQPIVPPRRAQPDTSGTPPDTLRAKPDSGAAPH